MIVAQGSIWVDVMECPGEFTGDVDIIVTISGPGGYDVSWNSGGDGYTSTSAYVWIDPAHHWGTYYAYADGNAYYPGGAFYDYAESQVFVPEPLPIPSGEWTNSSGWHVDGVHKWVQGLLPSGTSFYGRVVQEFPHWPGTDSCYFPDSEYDEALYITGGAWGVQSSNVWGPDYVGYYGNIIPYYRANAPTLPCGVTWYQSMRIDFSGGWVEYKVNTLRAWISASTVGTERDGQQAERIWP